MSFKIGIMQGRLSKPITNLIESANKISQGNFEATVSEEDQFEEIKILLTAPRGFCAGVDRAIEIVKKTLKKFNKVDVLVNGAGINAPTPIFDVSESEWDSIFDTHVKGTLFSCQVFGKYMVEKKQ